MKYTELKQLIKEEIEAVKAEIATENAEPIVAEDMMADPVSVSFMIGTVATLVAGFTAAVWKGMKDNEKQKLTKAVKELKPKEVKAIAEKAVEEVHSN